MKNLVLQDYLFDEAVALKFTEDKKFLLDKENFTKKAIIDLYNEKQIISAVNITEEEIKDFYIKHKSDYSDGSVAEVMILTFKYPDDAAINYRNIQEAYYKGQSYSFADSFLYKGLTHFQDSISITRESDNYPPDIVQMMFKMNDNDISPPLLDGQGGAIIVIKKEETGKIIRPLKEIRNDLLNKLKQMKFEELYGKRIEELKKKYYISIDKTSKYL